MTRWANRRHRIGSIMKEAANRGGPAVYRFAVRLGTILQPLNWPLWSGPQAWCFPCERSISIFERRICAVVIAAVRENVTGLNQSEIHVGDGAIIQLDHACLLTRADANRGDRSHSLICQPVSACRALWIISFWTAPCGSSLAFSRNRFASSARRSWSDSVCLKRRRCFGMTLPHSVRGRRERVMGVLITDKEGGVIGRVNSR